MPSQVFYREMLQNQVKKADGRAVRIEHAWDKDWCDFYDANPLTFGELHSLGVFRIKKTPPVFVPGRERRPIMPPMGGTRDFIKSLRVVEEPDYRLFKKARCEARDKSTSGNVFTDTLERGDRAQRRSWPFSKPVYQ